MELAKSKENSSPDHSRDGNDEALTPSTQDDDCIRRLLYAKSPEFDRDIFTTHSIVKEELKLAKEANEKLQHELKEKNAETAKNKEKYEHLKRRHTTFRDDVDAWSVQAKKKICVLCNLARPVAAVPVMSIGDLPDGASSSPAVVTVATAVTPSTSEWKTRACGNGDFFANNNIDL
jgi:hypothetical protein